MENYSKKALIDILAVTGSIVTITVALIPKEITLLIANYQLITILLFLVFIALIYFYITQKKCLINLKINETTKLNISYGDLFEKEGIVIIPVNDFFDTIVDDKIVSKKTLHGKFINKYFKTEDEIKNLREQIELSLPKDEGITYERKDGKGNEKKYPLGTTAIVEIDNKKFFLVAVSEFDISTNRATLKTSEYPLVLSRMMEFIHNYSQGYNVNMPLIGGGHLGINLPKEKLLEIMIFSMHTAEKISILEGINILLHDSVRKEINLNRVYYTCNKY